jgi:oxygen-independent coproporphyrinogen-3 oxidase
MRLPVARALAPQRKKEIKKEEPRVGMPEETDEAPNQSLALEKAPPKDKRKKRRPVALAFARKVRLGEAPERGRPSPPDDNEIPSLPALERSRSALGVYLHWPFCVAKCPYCDFASTAAACENETALLGAYIEELRHYAALTPDRRVGSIYFGGGTPSLMRPDTVAALIDAVRDLWPMDDKPEITLESNPVTAEIDKFEGFRAAGVNRLSVGVQSFSDERLRFLGRVHDAEQAARALHMARAVFPRFSFDLMTGFADQDPTAWEHELTQALSFGARHMSVYQLTIEPHTAFHLRQLRGERLAAEESLALEIDGLTRAKLKAAGLESYEVSNYAALGEESRHNLVYWTYGDYIGIGPAAHGRLCLGDERLALENQSSVKSWADQIAARGHGRAKKEPLSRETAAREALLMGLRLTQGVSSTLFAQRIGRSIETFLLPERWAKLAEEGLVETVGDTWRTTEAGRARLNSLLTYCLK